MCSTFNHSTFKIVKILVTSAIVLVFIAPPTTVGNPVTKRQFKKVVKLLEESLAKEIPSDDADEYADILYQEKFDKKNLTYYYSGDKKYPVFISNGVGMIGSKLHVLLRGEDYISPKDRNNFVVLKQLSSKPEAYTLHRAHVVDNNRLKKDTKVLWNDGRVEQQKNIKQLLLQMGNSEVQARSTRSNRPLCDWIGYSLLCATPKNIEPARERKEREPLDEEDDEPIKLPGVVSEESKGSEGAPKRKRYTDAETSKESEKGEHQFKTGNELDMESEESETPPPQETTTTRPTKKPDVTKKHSRIRIRTTTTVPTTQVPVTASEAETEKEEQQVTERNGEGEEQVTKKRHKKKRKSKKKHADANKQE